MQLSWSKKTQKYTKYYINIADKKVYIYTKARYNFTYSKQRRFNNE